MKSVFAPVTRSFRSFLPVLSLLFFVSCAPFTGGSKTDFYRSHPVSLFYTALQHGQEIESFEGKAHLTIESPVEGFQGNATIYYRRPDSLLVKLQAAFGVPVGSLLITGNRVQIYNIREKSLSESEGGNVPLNSLIGIGLRTENLFEAVLGLPRLPDMLTVSATELDSLHYMAEDGNFTYFIQTKTDKRKYIAAPDKQVFLQYVLFNGSDGDTTLCTFRQFRRFKNIRMPRHVQISRENPKERLSLFYTRMQVNKKFPNNRFKIKYPKDVKIIHLAKAKK